MGGHRTYSIVTYGCQMNESDSERLAGMLRQNGYAPADDMASADLVLLNTCCIRDSAAQTVFGKLGELKVMKQQRPELIVGVAGCLAESDASVMAKRAPHVDFFLGTRKMHKLPLALDRLSEHSPLIWIGDDELDEKALDYFVPRDHSFKAWVPIMRGCSYYCTFCIVPYVRGKQVSRESEAILDEVRGLAGRGYKEVILLGQTVDSYGKERKEELSFAQLLEAVDAVEGIERIRYTSPHPRDMTPETIRAIANSKHICEHFHLPVQSGSDAVLTRMRRGYSRARYLSLVNEIRSAVPGASFSTDLIVGFPGETEEEFDETLSLVKEVGFDTAYVFQYSLRQGTVAAKMTDHIEDQVKLDRLIRLNTQVGLEALARNQAVVGTVADVLVEGPSSRNPSRLTGRTRTNRLINFDGEKSLIGKTVPVHIRSAGSWSLDGELVSSLVLDPV